MTLAHFCYLSFVVRHFEANFPGRCYSSFTQKSQNARLTYLQQIYYVILIKNIVCQISNDLFLLYFQLAPQTRHNRLQRSSAWNITTNDVFNDVMQATESTHYDHRKLLVKN